MRRLPGGLPSRGAPRRPAPRRIAIRGRSPASMGRRARPARGHGRATHRAPRSLVSRQSQPRLVATQRARGARQRRRSVGHARRQHGRPVPRPCRPDVAGTRRLGCGAPGGARVKHLLVTNDFPPKIGGIQSLLWEWWRRLPPDRFAVLTSPYAGAAQFDSVQPYRIERTSEPVLLPHPWMVRRIDRLAREFGADLVVIDPAVPLGLVGPYLELPYDVVLHGAEVTVPGRLPGSRQALGNVLRQARHVISAGD